MTLHLQPGDLGSVQVRIERSDQGTTRISISAERADTLDLLQRSQGQLHQTLDTAGVPSVGREITFHSVPAASSVTSTLSDAALGGGDLSQQAQPNFGQSNGQTGDGSSRSAYGSPIDTGADQGRAPAGATPDTAASSARYRAGLDILA